MTINRRSFLTSLAAAIPALSIAGLFPKGAASEIDPGFGLLRDPYPDRDKDLEVLVNAGPRFYQIDGHQMWISTGNGARINSWSPNEDPQLAARKAA